MASTVLMQEPVSVIIPTYNRTEFLKNAIDSVLAQTYAHYELIIVDDGSEDNTAELVSSYGRNLSYIRQQNRGPAAARNAGIEAARYDLLAFLDSDDWFDKEKLATQLTCMQQHPNYLISHTQEVWYRRGRLLNQKKKHQKPDGFIFAQSLKLCAVGMSTVMARRKLFDLVGGFDENLPCCEDYDLWLRASIRHPFLLVDKPLTYKNGGRPDQLSSLHRIGMDKYRIRAIEKVLAANGLSAEQRQQAASELFKKCRIYGNGCIKYGRLEEGATYLDLAERHSVIS